MRGARNRMGQRGLNQPGFQMLNKGAKNQNRCATFVDSHRNVPDSANYFYVLQ